MGLFSGKNLWLYMQFAHVCFVGFHNDHCHRDDYHCHHIDSYSHYRAWQRPMMWKSTLTRRFLFDNKTNLSYHHVFNQRSIRLKYSVVFHNSKPNHNSALSCRTFVRRQLSRRRLWRMTSWRIFLQVRWTIIMTNLAMFFPLCLINICFKDLFFTP